VGDFPPAGFRTVLPTHHHPPPIAELGTETERRERRGEERRGEERREEDFCWKGPTMIT